MLFMPLLTKAQQAEYVRGILFKKGMLEKIAAATITNLKTNESSKSNFYGEFIIKASIGDTILVEKEGFTPYKQGVDSYSPLYITLLPSITLDQVTIQGQTKKQELNGVITDYRKKGIYFDGDPPVLARIFNPLTTLHELFGKDAKNEKRFIKYAKREQEATEVDRRYTPELVSKTTGLTGDDLKHFMENYRPSYDDLKKWADYDIIAYIKKSYETFKKVGYQAPVDIFHSKP